MQDRYPIGNACAFPLAVIQDSYHSEYLEETGGKNRAPPPPPPSKIHKIIGFFSNTDRFPENYKAAKPACNVGPSSTRQRSAILIAFRWRADGGPLLLVFVFFLLSSS